VQPGEGRIERHTTADGRMVQRRWVRLPELPIGRHRVRLDRPDLTTALTVAPARCHLPEALARGGRRFGIAGHLYSWRSDGDQEIGRAHV
jgi:glycogen operon protein